MKIIGYYSNLVTNESRSLFISKSKLLLLILITLITSLMIIGCDRDNSNERQYFRLIDRHRDMSIHRTDSMRTASVRFFTNFPAYCAVEYWQIKHGDNPPPGLVKKKSCYNSNSTITHFVRIEKLDPTQPLYIRVLTSSSDQTLSRFDDSIVLKETATKYSYFPPDGYREDSTNDVIVSVIKTNLTQASATVYSNTLSPHRLELEQEQFKLVNTGCRRSKAHAPGAILPPINVYLSQVSSSGYYSTKGKISDEKRGIMLLDFTGKLEPARNWMFKLRFDFTAEEINYSFRSPPEIRSASITHPQEYPLDRHDLITFSKGIELDTDQDISINWKAINDNNTDYVQITLGKASKGASIRCQSIITANKIDIPAEYLKQFANKTVDLIFSLNRKVIRKKDQHNHRLFLHTHDWRYKTIKFQ